MNHGSGLIELASNPYAAMPSVHSADALIIGFAMATLVKSRWAAMLWTLWPTWVWFSVMATGNHYWLDIAAGVGRRPRRRDDRRLGAGAAADRRLPRSIAAATGAGSLGAL